MTTPRTLVTIKRINWCVDDLRKCLGQLISAAFAVISSDANLLKKAGFSLIIALLQKFKTSIEQIRDEDEEGEVSQQQRIRAYLENPLLLEQYEAQIFSIIRQNAQLTATSDPGVVLRNFKLIYLFLTIPICKDASIVTKILQLLFSGEGDNVFANSFHHCEKMVSEVHFRKLKLISKVLIACISAEPFKRIECNPKHLKDERVQDENGLPSKFQKEDKARILEAFRSNQQLTQMFLSQMIKALEDITVITTIPKQALKNFTQLHYIRGGTHRSAYNPDTLDRAHPYFIKLVQTLLTKPDFTPK